MTENFFKKIQSFRKISGKIIFARGDLIAIYTILRILHKMKKTLGLEVMLEYIDYYIGALEKANKELRSVTTQVLEIMDVGKIYQEVKQ